MISNTLIIKNKRFGIEIEGKVSIVVIEDCSIIDNDGNGLICGIGTNCRILRNEIYENANGVILASSEASLISNIIANNKYNGVYSFTLKDMLNNSELKLN